MAKSVRRHQFGVAISKMVRHSESKVYWTPSMVSDRVKTRSSEGVFERPEARENPHYAPIPTIPRKETGDTWSIFNSWVL